MYDLVEEEMDQKYQIFHGHKKQAQMRYEQSKQADIQISMRSYLKRLKRTLVYSIYTHFRIMYMFIYERSH